MYYKNGVAVAAVAAAAVVVVVVSMLDVERLAAASYRVSRPTMTRHSVKNWPLWHSVQHIRAQSDSERLKNEPSPPPKKKN